MVGVLHMRPEEGHHWKKAMGGAHAWRRSSNHYSQYLPAVLNEGTQL